jgi:hypothetical protein
MLLFCCFNYKGGQIGFVLARKGETKSCCIPVRPCEFQSELKWYNTQMHRAAFTLPHYVQQTLSELDFYEAQNGFEEEEDDVDRCFLAECNIQ